MQELLFPENIEDIEKVALNANKAIDAIAVAIESLSEPLPIFASEHDKAYGDLVEISCDNNYVETMFSGFLLDGYSYENYPCACGYINDKLNITGDSIKIAKSGTEELSKRAIELSDIIHKCSEQIEKLKV